MAARPFDIIRASLLTTCIGLVVLLIGFGTNHFFSLKPTLKSTSSYCPHIFGGMWRLCVRSCGEFDYNCTLFPHADEYVMAAQGFEMIGAGCGCLGVAFILSAMMKRVKRRVYSGLAGLANFFGGVAVLGAGVYFVKHYPHGLNEFPEKDSKNLEWSFFLNIGGAVVHILTSGLNAFVYFKQDREYEQFSTLFPPNGDSSFEDDEQQHLVNDRWSW